jgi:hypothetical protein
MCDALSMGPVNLRQSRRAAVSVPFVTALALVGLQAFAAGAAGKPRRCKAPHLTGLVLSVARERALKAGCSFRVSGASVEMPRIQTIRRQSPGPGQHGRLVTVWVNQLCSGSALLGPPRGEPRITTGPTELVSGLYLDGGPLSFRSAPSCKSLSGTPGRGTINVISQATGVSIASRPVGAGHLARIPLPPGTYAVSGLFGDATINGQHPHSFPIVITIPPGKTVRQDVVLNVP